MTADNTVQGYVRVRDTIHAGLVVNGQWLGVAGGLAGGLVGQWNF